MSADNVKIANTYMKFRNSYNHGFMKYYYFKRIISFSTGLTDGVRIRAVFQKLLDDELIERRYEIGSKGKSVLRYRHNPYHIEGLKFYEKYPNVETNEETKINNIKNKKLKY